MEMLTKLQNISRPRILARLTGAVLAIAALWWSGHFALVKYQIWYASGLLHQGYSALAAQYLVPSRESITKSEQGCALFLEATGRSRLMQETVWGVESCQYNGIQIEEMPIAAAQILLAENSPDGALSAVKKGLVTYPKSARLFMLGILTLSKSHKLADAADFAKTAIETVTDSRELDAVALDTFVAASRNDDAKIVASRLNSVAESLPSKIRGQVEQVLAGGSAISAASPPPALQNTQPGQPMLSHPGVMRGPRPSSGNGGSAAGPYSQPVQEGKAQAGHWIPYPKN